MKSAILFILLIAAHLSWAQSQFDGDLGDGQAAVKKKAPQPQQPPRPSTPAFNCDEDVRASNTSQVANLFRTILGIQTPLREGASLFEREGNGNQVRLTVQKGESFQLRLDHVMGSGTLPVSVCWYEEDGGQRALKFVIDKSRIAGAFNVIATKVSGTAVHLSADTERERKLINFRYDVIAAPAKAGR